MYRRDFLKLSLSSLGVVTTFLGAPRIARATGSGPRALVCIEQLGGCDPFLFASPVDNARKAALLERRGGISEYYNDPNLVLLGYGSNLALHPGLYPLQEYLDNLRLTLGCANALHVPPTRSHQIAQLRMSLGTDQSSGVTAGWKARLYDTGTNLIGFLGAKGADFTCQSQHCKEEPPIVANSFEDFRLDGTSFIYALGGAANSARVAQIIEQLATMSLDRAVSPVEDDYRTAQAAMIQATQEIQSLIQTYHTPLHDSYETGDSSYNAFARRFRNIAQMMLYLSSTGSNERVVFALPHGSYDFHSDFTAHSEKLMGQLGGALGTFIQDLIAMNLFDNVVVTTESDFGRQIAANGGGSSAGTDHGSGMASLTIGGQVNGGSNIIYGDMLSVQQISGNNAWPTVIDSRTIIYQLIKNHLGLVPEETAFPNGIAAEFSHDEMNLLTGPSAPGDGAQER